MADKFSGTRKYFWRDARFISEYAKNSDKVLDLGCGNGRLLEIMKNKKIDYFGVDVSQELINIAKENYIGDQIQFDKISDSSSLSFPDDFFNVIFSIAVFHHFPKSYSLRVAKEIFRTTKFGGIVVISAWNLWQSKYLKHLIEPRIILKKIFQIGEYKGLGMKDVLIPFKNNQGERFNRFHHVFSERELADVFREAGFEIEKSFILNNKNIFIVGKKR